MPAYEVLGLYRDITAALDDVRNDLRLPSRHQANGLVAEAIPLTPAPSCLTCTSAVPHSHYIP